MILSSTGILTAAPVAAQPSCCTLRGNIDCDPGLNVDIADLSRLIDNLFISFDPLCCDSAANIDGDPGGGVDISDLSRLIDYMFISFTPPEPCGAGELSFAQRQAVFNAIDSVSNLIEGEPADSVAIKLAAFLNSLPDIDSAGVIDSISVWAWFSDGRLISIPNNRSYNGGFATGRGEQSWYAETEPPSGFVLPERRFPELSDADLALPTAPKTLHTPGGNFELPSSIQARLISNFAPTCFPQSVPIIKALLDNHGYVTQVVPGTVPSLLNVHDDGIFYIDTHGGPGKDRAGNRYLSLWTASAFSHSNDSAFAPLLRNDEVVYVFAWDLDPSNNTCGDHWRYGITGKFVARYMYFVPNSFIFINACEGDSVPSLRNGFMIAGASTYCGFTKTVSFPGSNRMADFMFDRLLGANASTLLPKESPPQRPFDIDPVLQDMTSRGYDTDPEAPHAKLRVQHLQNHMGIL
ncbi:MAG: hypothetical protein HY851_10495, partial [candidate division Zixibacteria bacterium]|nr:hypothetical protein [candidate division Zixibacteria bacterium]